MVIRRKPLIFIALFLLVLFLLPIFTFANDSLIGSVAPAFKVISGKKEVLASDDIKGKVAVLFYEAKSAIEQNRKLKTSLNVFYEGQPDSVKKDIVRIGVINCQGVFFRGAWEKGLRDNSLKEGIAIYGDWDGKMSAGYHIKEDTSNVIVIDRKGIIRYYASGKVEDRDISMIEELLESLGKEN
ncbi:MAG: hypothetical protein MUC39_03220 [Candidatus Omnitrophica bacterium]|jgi:predicted transcriptional regulator|nr:hypothetical protein [Candidatus Omnitrophota bacterium]